MKRTLFFTLIFTAIMLLITGCIQKRIEENQVYLVNEEHHFPEDDDLLNIEGRIPFQKYEGEDLEKYSDSNQVLLTISPDGEEAFLMEKTIPGYFFTSVIIGDPKENVRIVRKNVNTLEQEIIINNIPFVSKVSWNTEGDIVAFGGGGSLTIYDVSNNSIVMEEMLSQETITNFSWSPDSENKVYTEQPELANASIYYLSSQRKVEAYETREETYYKGKLDNDYYYGTRWDFTTGQIETVILDKQRKVIKTLIPGRFRDSYQKSLLVTGDNGFGLFYIKDINNPEEVITLTDGYVYDAKFVVDGKIAYTTKAEDIEDNAFYLNIASGDGNKLKQFKVPGGSIALSPDGSVGYINGPEWQRVNFLHDFLDEEIVIGYEFAINGEYSEARNIYATIRGGMITYYNYQLWGEKNWDNLDKYFINSENPEQWAHFDMENIFNREQEKIGKPSRQEYALEIEMKSYELKPARERATIAIRVSTKNVHGTGRVIDYTLELIKSDDRWYITGFSTFPDAEEREIIEDIVQGIVEEIQKGNTPYEWLKDKPIDIGQIQFWGMGMNYFAPVVESADAVKVFLRISEQEEEEIYKLVLEKTDQMDWEPIRLTKENLSSLE
jgi:hypothetical protein